MKVGRLDRRIVIERFTLVDDGMNEVEQFAELATVWASYTPAKGSERFELAGREAMVPVMFGIRWQPWSPQINPKDRIVYNGQVFNLTAVTEIGRREGLELYATAGD